MITLSLRLGLKANLNLFTILKASHLYECTKTSTEIFPNKKTIESALKKWLVIKRQMESNLFWCNLTHWSLKELLVRDVLMTLSNMYDKYGKISKRLSAFNCFWEKIFLKHRCLTTSLKHYQEKIHAENPPENCPLGRRKSTGKKSPPTF